MSHTHLLNNTATQIHTLGIKWCDKNLNVNNFCLPKINWYVKSTMSCKISVLVHLTRANNHLLVVNKLNYIRFKSTHGCIRSA